MNLAIWDPYLYSNTFSISLKKIDFTLQERTGKFRKQANAIAEWDRRILQNRDVLLRLEVCLCLQMIIFNDFLHENNLI
jgi:hypothetical protein